MLTRKASQVAAAFGIISAAAITCILLYSLIAGLSFFQGSMLLGGSLIVLWAIIFSFFEVRRISSGERSIGQGPSVDPDATRRILVEPPTGHPYPHHEQHAESAGFDQGQLTARLPDAPSLRTLFRRERDAEKAERR